jgi:response regulator of citrate/malate metabolism
MILNCAIIDDEPLAAGLLKSYAEKTPFLHLIGTYGSAIEAMKQLRDQPAQLLFLDIQMPELSGIEFAKILPPTPRSSSPPPSSNTPSKAIRFQPSTIC